MKNRGIIVGVDAGVTCGLAVLSLNGELIHVNSHRSLKQPELITMLASMGDPVIIAVDVQTSPQLAERLARNFGALLFVPHTFLPVINKMKIVQDFETKHSVKLADQHQKDALAAALKAFNYYKNKFNQLEAHIKRVEQNIPMDEAKGLIVQGINIAEAIETLKKEREIREAEPKQIDGRPPPTKSYIEALTILKGKVREQKLQLRRLRVLIEEKRLEIEALRRNIETLTEKVSQTRKEYYSKLRREQEYRRLNLEIHDLHQKVAQLEERLASHPQNLSDLKEQIDKGEIIILRSLTHFTQKDVESLIKEGKISSENIVLILDPSGGGASTAKQLIDRNIKAIIAGKGLSHPAQEEFTNAEIPILEENRLPIKWVQNTPYIETEKVERAIVEYELKQKKIEGTTLRRLLTNYPTEPY